MRKRFWSLLLAVLLLCQLALPQARAEDPEVYFTAVGESVLPLSDATMPFWKGGYLYIASSVFTGNVWKSMGISYIRNNKGTVILHNASQAAGRSLLFEPGKDFCKDSDGNVRKPGAIERGGIVFVPAFLVADFFGLLYSVTKVPHGYLVWLRKPDFGLSDKYFADAANYNMEAAYSTYLKNKNRAPTPAEPEREEPSDNTPGAGIYLSLEAGAETEAMLNVLDQHGGYGAFFCTPDYLEQNGHLLRRMAATGHTVGLIADAAHETLSIADQLEQGNQALERATCGRTRLVWLRNADEARVTETENMGYVCLTPDLDRTAYQLRGSSNAASLMNRISAYRDSVTVWLGDTASAAGLRHFLEAVRRADDRCFALTETAA